MKNLFLLLFGMTAFTFSTNAQITPESFESEPLNTGANMTVGMNTPQLDQFAGGTIAAFIDVDGVTTMVGKAPIQLGFFGLAVWGDDSSTPEQDGCLSGETPTFALLTNEPVQVIHFLEAPSIANPPGGAPGGYITNNTYIVTECTLTGPSGCNDPGACNPMFMYQGVDYENDGSCDYDSCTGCMDDGACNYNADATTDDGSCDFTSCAGCMDNGACNFDASASIDDGSCVSADPSACQSCSGETDGSGVIVTSDADGDGVCDGDEVVGCQDADACNYDALATDAGDCNVPVGCDSCDDDGNVVDNDADGDGVCDADEIVGCMNPAASNFDPLATDAADEDSQLACVIEGVNFTCLSDAANTSIHLTSNNMSVLFPVNNAGIWNSDVSNVQEGDLIAAVYETGRLDNDFLGYSAVTGLANGGSLCGWDGDQQGLAVFGADNGLNNGFQPGEELKWMIQRDGVVYNATVTYATSGFDGAYEEGAYVTVNSIVLGARADEGCMDPNFMEFDPMATTDDESCSTYISIGCMDANAVNYAGADVDADAIHDNALNHDNPFGENLTVDLNSGMTSPSGAAAIFHDQSMCQTQVEGCTDPMAINYDPFATQNDATICDWTLNGMQEYDVDHDGNILGIDYEFGAVDASNENDGIVGSDFDNAQLLFDEGALDPEAHVIDNLADVMEWIDMDEERDAQELADTISDMQDRYDANDAQWAADYAANDEFLRDSIAYTLDSAAVAFAQDEAEDLELLNNTIQEWSDRLDSTEASDDAILAQTIADAQAKLDSTEASDDAILAQTIADAEALLAQTIADMQAAYDANDAAHIALEGLITDSLDHHRAPIVIDLHTGWNTVAYYLHHPSPVVAQFEAQFGSEEDIQDNINIVKNNEGDFYWPDFLFDGLEMLLPGQGYQVRVKNSSPGKQDFVFLHEIGENEYRELTPTVPAWAIDMPLDIHPNDVRTLVRVVNMLGQEVEPANQFAGEVLLYMYNDGTVEKRMVE